MSYIGIGVSPGHVAVINGSNTKVIDRRIKVAELVIRCFVCVFSVISAVLIGTDSQTKELFSIQKKAKFTDMRSLVILVDASGLVAAYSVVQGLRCVVSMVRGTSVVLNKSLAWAIFSADQVIAYLMLAVVVAAIQSSMLAKLGEADFEWMEICHMYSKFCNQIAEGIVIGLVASIGMIALSSISAFNLFRLYSRKQK